jgi:hypothetical protein
MKSIGNAVTFGARTASLPFVFGMLAALAALDVHAAAFGLDVNGTCKLGTCAPAAMSAFAEGDSLSQPFSFTTTLPNGDEFLVSGLLNASNSNTEGIVFNDPPDAALAIRYLGNPDGGPSHNDTLTVTSTFRFAVSFTSTDFSYFINGGFSPNIASGSSATAIGLNNGVAKVTLGPFTSPGPFSDSATYDADHGTFVTLGETTISSFAAGSPVGSGIFYGAAAAVPEPSTHALICVGLALLAFAAKRASARPQSLSTAT